MTPTEKKKALIETTLTNTDWVLDRWGHLQKEVSGEDYRIKMQKTSMRYEVRIGKLWVNLRSDYYKNVEVFKEGVFILGVGCK